MGDDKHKVNRQRNIHLSGDCGNAADMERDLLYVFSLLWFVEDRPGKDNGYLVFVFVFHYIRILENRKIFKVLSAGRPLLV